MEPSDWARLASLLKRVNSEIEGELVRDPVPELDDEFFTALDLVLTRINLAKFRLSVAVAAINAVRGRPKGSEGADLARALAGLWAQFTGQKATVSSATGKATGPFVDYCNLARKLLPTAEQNLIQITPDVIAKACRRPVATT